MMPLIFAIVLFFVMEEMFGQVNPEQFMIRPNLLQTLHHPVSNDTLYDESEVHAVTSPDDENLVAAFYHHFEASYARLGYSFSTDGGNTWMQGILPGYGFDPVGGISRTGEIFYAYILYNPSGFTYPCLSRTRDLGKSWVRQVIDSTSGADKIWLTVDNSQNDSTNGNCYVGWVRFRSNGSDVFFARGTPPNYDFTTVVLDTSEPNYYAQGVNITVNKNGVVIVTYYKIYTGDYSYTIYLFCRYSTDGGITFSAPFEYGRTIWARTRLVRGIDIGPLPSLAVDDIHPTKVRIAVAERPDYWKVVLYSLDLGTSSVEREVVTTDGRYWYCYPSVAIKNGRTFVQYTKFASRSTLDTLELEQVVAERLAPGDYAVYCLLAKPQILYPNSSRYWTHHYNQVAISRSGQVVYDLFTDYRNPTNDIWCEVVRLPAAGIVEKGETPKSFFLFQNYPNPFNPTTVIKYRLAVSGFVRLTVYNGVGQVVATLENGVMKEPGSYAVRFNAENLPSGVYFYRLQAGSFTETKKMVLLR
jgi:hypothetical protein